MSSKNRNNNNIEKPKVLYIPWDKPIHHPEAWKTLNDNFTLIEYNHPTIEDYIEELKKPNNGRYNGIKAICRSTWLKSMPYKSHLILKNEAVRLLPTSVEIVVESGHGFDVVDVPYLTSQGIAFCNSPQSCDRATADVGIYLILASFRYLSYAEKCIRDDRYQDHEQIFPYSEDPKGKTLGIIGLGNIGFNVAKAASAFGMKIIYNSPSRKTSLDGKLKSLSQILNDDDSTSTDDIYCKDLKDLYSKSDCIFISCPYTKETHHLINKESFKLMKSKVRIVNIARGPIISELDLIDAINNKQVIGCGLDVLEFEPKVNELLRENYMITILPHVGVGSRDSFKEFERKCVSNLMDWFYGDGIPKNLLNTEVLGK